MKRNQFYVPACGTIATLCTAAPLTPFARWFEPTSLLGAACLTLLICWLAVACVATWCCSCALLRRGYAGNQWPPFWPLPLVVALGLGAAARAFAPADFGWQLAAELFIVAVCLAQLGFVAAGAAVDAADRGQVVPEGLVTAISSLGGVPGVLLARRMFGDSEAIKKLPTQLPNGAAGMAVIALGLIACVWLFNTPAEDKFPAPTFVPPGVNADLSRERSRPFPDDKFGPVVDPITGRPPGYRDPAREQFDVYDRTNQQLTEQRKRPATYEENKRELDRLIGSPTGSK